MEAKQYVAVTYFEDMEDDNTAYEAGTIYPREGVEVSDERIKALLTGKNKRNKQMIAELKQLDPKPTERELLEAKKLDELKALATEKGLEFDAKATKPNIVDLLLSK